MTARQTALRVARVSILTLLAATLASSVLRVGMGAQQAATAPQIAFLAPGVRM